MKKIIGIGEVCYTLNSHEHHTFTGTLQGDILRPFLCLPSLGVSPILITEISTDALGQLTYSFLREQGILTDYIYQFSDGQTPLAIQMCDKPAVFYAGFPRERCGYVWPRVDEGDVFVFSASFSLDKAVRPSLLELIEYVRTRKSFVLCDATKEVFQLNVLQTKPIIMDNYELSHLIFTSDQVIAQLYQEADSRKVYQDSIQFFCPFLLHFSVGEVTLHTPSFYKKYALAVDSDLFKAQFIRALSQFTILPDSLSELAEREWDAMISDCCNFIGR